MNSVTIVTPGRFQTAYHLAAYLERQGRLERLVTPIPYRRTTAYGVSRGRTVALDAFGYWTFGSDRYGPVRLRSLNQRLATRSYGWTAAHRLGRPATLVGWCSTALDGLRWAHENGVPTVLQSGSTHIGWQTDVLRAEFEHYGYKGPLTSPHLVDRILQEIALADVIVAPSRFAIDTFRERGVPERKLFVVPWGVAPVGGSSPQRLRPEGESRPFRALFVGNFTLRKGVPYLFAMMKRVSPNVTLRMVGPVDRKLLTLLGGFPDRVESVGPKHGPDLAREYAAADVFVMPSVEDGSPYAVFEAMAAGLPVVVSNQTGAEQVQDGVNGFVVPARDAEALRERVDRLCSDDGLRAGMGAAAAATVAAHRGGDFGEEFDRVVLRPLTPKAECGP